MPMIYEKEVSGAAKLGVWHITEAEEFFAKTIVLKRGINHPHKRIQHLAARFLLHQIAPQISGRQMQIGVGGKPFFTGENGFFSLSHCGNYAAAIFSNKQHVGIDIETPHPKIASIAPKFLSPAERKIIGDPFLERPEILTMAWSIKEAVFKWYGMGGVDFIRDINIRTFTGEDSSYISECNFLKNGEISLQVRSIMIAGNNLSYVLNPQAATG